MISDYEILVRGWLGNYNSYRRELDLLQKEYRERKKLEDIPNVKVVPNYGPFVPGGTGELNCVEKAVNDMDSEKEAIKELEPKINQLRHRINIIDVGISQLDDTNRTLIKERYIDRKKMPKDEYQQKKRLLNYALKALVIAVFGDYGKNKFIFFP